jgi:hypothetical protein
MNKYLIGFLLVCCLTSCTTRDAHYYRSNLKELQEVLKSCPEKAPAQVSCEKLSQIAQEMNQLSMQLQSNPQGFGRQILKLQHQIATLEADLKKHPTDSSLKQSIAEAKRQEADYLAVVKWLESPEG